MIRNQTTREDFWEEEKKCEMKSVKVEVQGNLSKLLWERAREGRNEEAHVTQRNEPQPKLPSVHQWHTKEMK